MECVFLHERKVSKKLLGSHSPPRRKTVFKAKCELIAFLLKKLNGIKRLCASLEGDARGNKKRNYKSENISIVNS